MAGLPGETPGRSRCARTRTRNRAPARTESWPTAPAEPGPGAAARSAAGSRPRAPARPRARAAPSSARAGRAPAASRRVRGSAWRRKPLSPPGQSMDACPRRRRSVPSRPTRATAGPAAKRAPRRPRPHPGGCPSRAPRQPHASPARCAARARPRAARERRRPTGPATSQPAPAASPPPRPRAYSADRAHHSNAPTTASRRAANRRARRPGREPSARVPQVPPSPRALSAIAPIVRSSALSRVGEFDHPLHLRGRPLLVAQGSHEGAVAQGAIAALGGQPRVPRARDPLRRAPPLLQQLSLPQRRLGNPRVAVVSDAGVVPSGSASSRTKKHVPHPEGTTTSIPRTQSALEIRWPYAIRP